MMRTISLRLLMSIVLLVVLRVAYVALNDKSSFPTESEYFEQKDNLETATNTKYKSIGGEGLNSKSLVVEDPAVDDNSTRAEEKFGSLQAAYALALAKADRAAQGKDAAVAALRAAESADANRIAKLEDTLKRTTTDAAELTKARREVAQENTMRLAGERAAIAALASATAKADQSARAKAAAVAALHVTESLDADDRAKLEDAQTRMAAVNAELADAKREAAQTKASLAGERAAGNALRAALDSAKAKADQAGREKMAAVAALHADADHVAKLEDSQKRTAAIAGELAGSKHEAAQAVATLTAERAAAGALRAALTSAQAKADQAGREKTAADAALRLAESADADRRATLEDAQTRMGAITAELADAKREAAQAMARLADERAAGNALRAALGSAQAKADQVDREKTATVAALHADVDRRAKVEDLQKRMAAVTAELGDAKRKAAQAAETARLASERAAGSALQAALSSAQAKADQAGREKAAADAALQLAESADAGHRAKLEDAQTRMAALAAELANARREAAQATANLAGERAGGSALQAALGSMQAKANQAGREKVAAVAALHMIESADAAHRAELEDSQKRMAALVAQLATAKREAVQVTARRVASERDGVSAETENSRRSNSLDTLAADQGSQLLPDGALVHVILHYALSSDPARVRAAAIKSTLSDLGLDVVDLSDMKKAKINKTHVTYYYKQDQSVAIGIADKIKASEPVQTRISTARIPRPGTIEVLLGG